MGGNVLFSETAFLLNQQWEAKRKGKREDGEERKMEKKENFSSDIVPDTVSFPMFQCG